MVLHGNVNPKARPEFDVGASESSLPMKRMTLLLKIAPEKQAELDRLLAEQQDPSSPYFHRRLTPEEFGKRFGPSREEIATVKNWLVSRGFTIERTAKSRAWINFSGTVADVERAFHVSMHDYRVEGHLYHANSTDPSIPRALTDLVAGPVKLNNFSLEHIPLSFWTRNPPTS
ncbi:MAG: protease pro-enzyme activation domain-containing protein [Syntrophobacteraceae bacterium]